MNRQEHPRFPAFLSLAAACFLASLLSIVEMNGCASANPVTAATDTDQRAYALYGTFVVVEEQAARLMRDSNVPVTVKVAIQRADGRAKPSADALLQALIQVENVRAQLKAGKTTDDVLALATANLGTWLTQATADIRALVNAVQGTLSSSSSSSVS